jgi:hypothetical protein
MIRYLTIVMIALSALTLAGCPASTPGAPTPTPVASASPASRPTSLAVVRTTAKRLDPSAVATVTAGPLLDVPDGKYLLLKAQESTSFCFSNCSCPAQPTDSSGALSPSDQGQAMREMVRQGARGFVDVSVSSNLQPCACTTEDEGRGPVEGLPFSWSAPSWGHELSFTLYRVDRDGTVTARVGGALYAFKPGDTWSSEFVNPNPAPPDCLGDLERGTMSFRNGGLLDESQFPELSAPTPMPAAPTTVH